MMLRSEFWRWWTGELASLAPIWLRIAFFGGSSARRLKFSDDLAEIRTRSDRVEAPVSLLGNTQAVVPRLSRSQVVDVVLPDAFVLKRRIEVPAKARRNMETLAALDLKRNTPFPDGTTVWALGRARAEAKHVGATQYVAKIADLQALRRRLSDCGLKVRRFLTGGAESIPLQDFSKETAPNARGWRVVNGVLALAIGAVGTFLWLSPAWVARGDLQNLEADLTALRSETLAQRQRVQALDLQRSDEERLRADLRLRPRLIETIRAATVSTPDAAWIAAMTFTPQALTLSGETTGAAVDLVLEFTRNNQFGNPRLSGATTRTAGGREKFEIAASPRGAQ